MEEKVTITKIQGPGRVLVEIETDVVLWPNENSGVSRYHPQGQKLEIRVVVDGSPGDEFKLELIHADPAQYTGIIDQSGSYQGVTTIVVI